MPYEKLINKFHRIQGLTRKNIVDYEQKIENVFKNMMDSLKAEFVKFREQF